jgi:hypothetical protein
MPKDNVGSWDKVAGELLVPSKDDVDVSGVARIDGLVTPTDWFKDWGFKREEEAKNGEVVIPDIESFSYE